MTAFSMPTSPGFVSCRFGLETNTQKFQSPLSRATQRIILGGSRWKASYNLPTMNRHQASLWRAFLLKLEGGVHTVNAYDPDYYLPRGNPTGTPLVNGASQTGSSLVIDGCTANVIGWLLPGDYFSVNGEFKMITDPVNTNGSGQATINFKPALRASPADNAALTVTRATCNMILVDDNQSFWETDKEKNVMGMSFSLQEVFS